MKMKQSVPKRRHIKFRRRQITQKKTYNIYICVRKVPVPKLVPDTSYLGIIFIVRLSLFKWVPERNLHVWPATAHIISLPI